MKEEKKSALIAQAVTWRKTGEEAVILNLETSEYYSANETGTFIWEQLSAGKKPGKIAAAPALAAEDTAAFLKDLTQLKILAPEAKK